MPSIIEGGTGILCKRDGYVCRDRRAYVFFDGLHLHPTEAVNHIIAKKACTSTLQTEVYPINLRQLVALQLGEESNHSV